MTARLLPVAGAAAQVMARNRSALIFTGSFYLLVTFVLSRVWVAAADGQGGMVAGYSATALVWYIATTEAATIAQPHRVIERMGADIVDRRIETELLRPVDPLRVRLAIEMGTLAPRLALCGALGLGFATVAGGAPPHLGALALAAPALVLAAVLNLVAQHAFAGATFWLRETRTAWFLYQKMIFVLGGMLLPLEVLPDPLEAVARWTPFAAMAYIPARLAAGHVEPERLLVQLGWLAALLVVAHRVVAAGERRFVTVGA